ncbi:hypothetical protein OSTOST_07175 [Ostertagia ostertagi]
MIGFDTLISLVDTVGRYLSLGDVFEPERCASEPRYLILYIITDTASSVLELTESILIVCKYPNTARILFGCLMPMKGTSDGPGPIVNVLGSDLMSQQQNSKHFDHLIKSWGHHQKLARLHRMGTLMKTR